MATKLKNLKIRKVDFVDAGANPDAHIGMVKRKNGMAQATEEGREKEHEGILKKLIGFICKAAGMEQSEVDSAIEEIQKGNSVSFNEKLSETRNRKIADEIWDICYALQTALCSILYDEELDSSKKQEAMTESIEEFFSVAQKSIKQWSFGREAGVSGKREGMSETDLKIMKSAAERLNKSIESASADADKQKKTKKENGNAHKNQKGDEKEMKIDKRKLTDAERAFLESIEKRYGMDDSSGEPAADASAGRTEAAGCVQPVDMESSVAKAASEPTLADRIKQPDDADSIYKGLHPAVKAELEGLKKFREEAENRELAEIAKKYEIIGKKQEELVPLLKNLKAAGGTAYHDMIALLDQTVDTIEKSGVFSEIGKSGHPGSEGTAEAKISSIAKGYMEKDAGLSYAEAVAKAWEDNPEIMLEYEEQAGF